MKEGVVTEIAALAKSASNQKDPHTKEVLGRTLLFEPEGDGKYKRTDLGGPGVQPSPLHLHTLTGLVTYLLEPTGTTKDPVSYPLKRDGIEARDVIVRVVNHEAVAVESALDAEAHAYRKTLAISQFAPLIGSNGVAFKFGEYMDLEPFNVALQTLFADNTDRTRVLLVTGTVSDEKVVTSKDDGVTQRVVASAGVVGVYETETPNPVRLIPFRTFREVAQPESLFVLRMKRAPEGSGRMPQVALFEADGGKWKLEAIENIATFLRTKLPGVTILA